MPTHKHRVSIHEQCVRACVCVCTAERACCRNRIALTLTWARNIQYGGSPCLPALSASTSHDWRKYRKLTYKKWSQLSSAAPHYFQCEKIIWLSVSRLVSLIFEFAVPQNRLKSEKERSHPNMCSNWLRNWENRYPADLQCPHSMVIRILIWIAFRTTHIGWRQLTRHVLHLQIFRDTTYRIWEK